MRNLFFLTTTLLLLNIQLNAGIVETKSYYSQLLKRDLAYSVILPDNYPAKSRAGSRFPVVYLLHCAGCTQDTWLVNSGGGYSPAVQELIDNYNYIAIAPAGDVNWWLDSPIKQNFAWSSFLVQELKPLIDSTYTTYTDRGNTGFTGHSMGGFGSLHNAITHPEIIGLAAAIKPGSDLRLPLNPNWISDFNLYNVLGSSANQAGNWEAVNVLKNIYKLKGRGTAIQIYNGLSDTWFAAENAELHRIMDSLNIKHEYFPLNQNHSMMDKSLMKKALDFFDTTFVYNGVPSAGNRFAGSREFKYTFLLPQALFTPSVISFSAPHKPGPITLFDSSGKVIFRSAHWQSISQNHYQISALKTLKSKPGIRPGIYIWEFQGSRKKLRGRTTVNPSN